MRPFEVLDFSPAEAVPWKFDLRAVASFFNLIRIAKNAGAVFPSRELFPVR